MRALIALTLALCLSSLFAQAPTATRLPKDPDKLLAMAQPFYDFSSADLKPWHMRVSYQLYDDRGNPSEQGTYEYWWASPQKHRSTWTRAKASHTDWYTPEKGHIVSSTGESLNYFEYEMQRAFLSPLPAAADVDPEKYRLAHETYDAGKTKLPCVEVIPIMPQHGQIQTVPLGLFPSYCFDVNQPALLVSFAFASITTLPEQISSFQNHYIPRHISILEGRRKLITANIDDIGGIDASHSALTPPADTPSSKVDRVSVDSSVTAGLLVDKKAPVYPEDAKHARVSGTVVLRAVIGVDGHVHELRVVKAPWPSLAASALETVSQWHYKQYLLQGNPVEVETTINVIYSLSY